MVTNKTGDYKDTLISCTKALDIDEKAVKAYFLRSQAHFKLRQYDEAIDDIKEAIKLSPNDKSLRNEFETIKKARAAHNETEQKNYQKFFK